MMLSEKNLRVIEMYLVQLEEYTNISQHTGKYYFDLFHSFTVLPLSMICISDNRFALTVHFLNDILAVLCELNKLFQMSGIHPSEVEEKITATIVALEGRYVKNEIQ